MRHLTMRQLVSATCGLMLALSGVAQAEAQPVVVELFTSQGCSSCPTADEFLMELAQRPDIIALSMHVDYWDYIGWKDTFAQSQFTSRQKAYAKAIGSRTIYTPQMIVNGLDRVEGNSPDTVLTAIDEQKGGTPSVELHLIRQGDAVTIKATPLKALEGPTRIELFRYTPEATVQIGRGENAGLEVTYTNIVTQWTPLGIWAGDAPLELVAPAEGEQPLVVIVQSEGPGEIIAAAKLD